MYKQVAIVPDHCNVVNKAQEASARKRLEDLLGPHKHRLPIADTIRTRQRDQAEQSSITLLGS